MSSPSSSLFSTTRSGSRRPRAGRLRPLDGVAATDELCSEGVAAGAAASGVPTAPSEGCSELGPSSSESAPRRERRPVRRPRPDCQQGAARTSVNLATSPRSMHPRTAPALSPRSRAELFQCTLSTHHAPPASYPAGRRSRHASCTREAWHRAVRTHPPHPCARGLGTSWVRDATMVYLCAGSCEVAQVLELAGAFLAERTLGLGLRREIWTFLFGNRNM